MRKRHLIIGLIIIALSFYYAFKNVSIAEIGDALLSVRYIYLIPAVLMIALGYLIRAMRWRYLIGSIKEVKTVNLLSPLFVGFMGNLLPARAGEVIRAYLLGKKENISFSASFATIFIERLFDLISMLLLLFWVLIFRPGVFVSGGSGESHKLLGYMIKFGWISFIGVIFIFLFSALLQYKNEWAMQIIGFFIKPFPWKWGDRITRLVQSFSEGLKIVKDKRGFIAVILLSFLLWGTFVFSYYPLYLAFNIEGQLPIISSLVILCLTIGIFISLFPTPGFLGAFQAACVVALHEIFKIPKAVAASYGIIAWLVAMGFVTIVGTIFIIKDNISLGSLSSDKEKTT